MVPKECFEKVNFEKKSADDNKSIEYYAAYRTDIQLESQQPFCVDDQSFTTLRRSPANCTKLACTPIDVSDQHAHPRCLVRVIGGRSMGSHESKVSSVGKLRF